MRQAARCASCLAWYSNGVCQNGCGTVRATTHKDRPQTRRHETTRGARSLCNNPSSLASRYSMPCRRRRSLATILGAWDTGHYMVRQNDGGRQRGRERRPQTGAPQSRDGQPAAPALREPAPAAAPGCGRCCPTCACPADWAPPRGPASPAPPRWRLRVSSDRVGLVENWVGFGLPHGAATALFISQGPQTASNTRHAICTSTGSSDSVERQTEPERCLLILFVATATHIFASPRLNPTGMRSVQLQGQGTTSTFCGAQLHRS